MTPLSESRFSIHFFVLMLMGAWIMQDRKPTKMYTYVAYKLFMTAVAWYGSYMLTVDLYLSLGNFKKMTWNLCISTLFTGSLIKNLFCLYYSPFIEKLRQDLHKDGESRKSVEYFNYYKSAVKNLKYIEVAYFTSAVFWVPFWLVTQYLSYLWGPRQWPVPLSLPFEVDMNDDLQYNVGFFLMSLAAITALFMIMEQELAMFTLLIQIAREYQILLKDIQNINKLYEDENVTCENDYALKKPFYEINPFLRKLKTKMIIKNLSIRQQKLIEYTEAFESCFTHPMFLEFFGLTLVIVASLVQAIMEAGNLSVPLFYQLGYSLMLLLNMFLVCLFATKLNTYCCQVGEEFYFTFWYAMSLDIQKDICMVIMRSQSPPKITTGKFIEINLNAFMIFVRNIYSTVTLFQQLEVKI